MRTTFIAVWAIVLSLSAPAAALPAPSGAPAERLDQILNSAISWKLTPSISIAVVRDGKIAYAGARGSADVQNRRSARTDTRYPIGSLGALFVAVAIVQLDAKGKLRLDDSLTRYLPPAESLDIPLRQLLPPQEDDIAKSEVLAAVVERVTGEPLITYLTDHVFRPAGMTQTWLGEPPDWLPLASGYYQWKDDFGLAQRETGAWDTKCCSFVSTATDLARFDVALLRGTLIPAESFRQLQPAFFAAKKAGMRVIGRMGTPAGYDAENAIFPNEGFAIVTLTNCTGFAAPPVLDRVLAVYYPAAAAAGGSADRQGNPDQALTDRLRRVLTTRYGLQAVRSMDFLSSSTSAGSTEYRYLVDLAGETKSAFFLINAAGNIDGFWVHSAAI